MIAFLRQRRTFIRWPNARDRNDIKFNFESEHGIPDCVGIVDGFHVNLSTAPARDDDGAFHSRKERYGYNVLGIIDDTERFTYLHNGYPASSSDMRVQRSAETFNHPDDHFSRLEYILADSGFTASECVLPMFRKPRADRGVMRGRPAYLNLRAATMRYKVEQAIGILKSRWTILRNLPLPLRTVQDQALAHGIIVACVMLHNMVIKTDDEPLDDEEQLSALDAKAAREGQAAININEFIPAENQRRREKLVTDMLSMEEEEVDLRDWIID